MSKVMVRNVTRGRRCLGKKTRLAKHQSRIGCIPIFGACPYLREVSAAASHNFAARFGFSDIAR
jgi:hypothetical protein